MVNELMNAMRYMQAETGQPVRLIRLTRGQYRELVDEVTNNPRYREALSKRGEVEVINGARVEVV